MKKAITVLIAALILAALIFDAKNMTEAVRTSVETCLYIIIPALFGFMAVSSYLIKSGLYRIIFKPFFLLFCCIIKLDEEEFGIFLLSLFGGYPVGAKLLADNTELTDKYNILPFCYCPSPGFVVTVAGIGLFSSAKAGFLIYISNLLACVILAVLLTRKNKKSSVKTTYGFSPPVKLKQTDSPLQDVFISSVMSASSSLFPVCAIIVTFGVIAQVFRFYFNVLGLSNPLNLFYAVLEISNASSLPPNRALLPLIAALFSFGGICIIMQIPALTKGKISLKNFYLCRIPAALMSAVLCRILLPLFKINAAIPVTAGNTGFIKPTEAQNPIASSALLIMAVILLKTTQEKPV